MTSHTFESVMKHFGDDAQLVGGSIVVNVDGKNVEVGHKHNSTGVFTLTSKGFDLLERQPQGKPKRATPSKGNAQPEPQAEVTVASQTPQLPAIDLEIDGK